MRSNMSDKQLIDGLIALFIVYLTNFFNNSDSSPLKLSQLHLHHQYTVKTAGVFPRLLRLENLFLQQESKTNTSRTFELPVMIVLLLFQEGLFFWCLHFFFCTFFSRKSKTIAFDKSSHIVDDNFGSTACQCVKLHK